MPLLSADPPPDGASVRRYLCDALRIDLLGPRPDDAALRRERLPQAPSRWHLTGFPVPMSTPMQAARGVGAHRAETDAVTRAVGERAGRHADGLPAGVRQAVADRVRSLVDDWAALAREAGQVGVAFGYARGGSEGAATPLLREMIDPTGRRSTTGSFASARRVRCGMSSRARCSASKTPEGRDVET